MQVPENPVTIVSTVFEVPRPQAIPIPRLASSIHTNGPSFVFIIRSSIMARPAINITTFVMFVFPLYLSLSWYSHVQPLSTPSTVARYAPRTPLAG